MTNLTSEDYVILLMFIEACSFNDFKEMFQGVNFNIKDDVQLIHELEFARTDFENWYKRYNESEILKFLDFAEDFDGR